MGSIVGYLLVCQACRSSCCHDHYLCHHCCVSWQEFLCMLRLHGIPVPSTALPKTPRNSQNMYTPPSPAPTPALTHSDNIPFMSSMGSKRIFARNGGSGTVASVHQFGLEDTATMMDADCDEQPQASVSDMEQAVEVILQEIGEDMERPVSSLFPCLSGPSFTLFSVQNACVCQVDLLHVVCVYMLTLKPGMCWCLCCDVQHRMLESACFITSHIALPCHIHLCSDWCRNFKALLKDMYRCCWHLLLEAGINLPYCLSSVLCPLTLAALHTFKSGMCNSRRSVSTTCSPSMEQLTLQ